MGVQTAARRHRRAAYGIANVQAANRQNTNDRKTIHRSIARRHGPAESSTWVAETTHTKSSGVGSQAQPRPFHVGIPQPNRSPVTLRV